MNETGLNITVLSKHQKSLDAFANLKHTDRKIYEAALQYARENDFDDAIVLNENNTVADAAIYNVFIVKDGHIYTPPLSDGPVVGVLRELLLTSLPNTKIIEQTITIKDLYTADELFLTNVIKGIRWVRFLDERKFSNTRTLELFEEFRQVVAEHFGIHLV